MVGRLVVVCLLSCDFDGMEKEMGECEECGLLREGNEVDGVDSELYPGVAAEA